MDEAVTATEAEWKRRGQGPSAFRYNGGAIGRTHRSWRLLNVGGEARGVLVRFSGSVFDSKGFAPISAALALGPYAEVLYDEDGNYSAKTMKYRAEKQNMIPQKVGTKWQLEWTDIQIPAGYVAAADQSIKRRISVKDVDRAFELFDEPQLEIVLYGGWEHAAGKLRMDVLSGTDLHLSYSMTESVRAI